MTDSNQQIFTPLWTEAAPRVRAYVSGQIAHSHDVDDVLQKIAIAMLDRFGSYDSEKPFGAWAMGFARLELLKYRQAHARGRLVFGEAALAAVESAYAQTPTVSDEGWKEMLQSCLTKLTDKAQQAIQWHYWGDMDSEVLAKRMGVTANHLRVMLHRARASLKTCVESQSSSINSEESSEVLSEQSNSNH